MDGNVIKLRIFAPWRSQDEVKRKPGFHRNTPDSAALHPGYASQFNCGGDTKTLNLMTAPWMGEVEFHLE